MTCHGQGHRGISGNGLYGFEQCHVQHARVIHFSGECNQRRERYLVILLFKRPAEEGQDPQLQQIDAERAAGIVPSKSKPSRNRLFSQEILDGFLAQCRWKCLNASETRANVENFSFQQTPADAMEHARGTSALAHSDQNTESGIRVGVPTVVLWICDWRGLLSRPDAKLFDWLRTEGWHVGCSYAFSPSWNEWKS
jgi:hypothetical protein